jgi:hypothetical protein
LQARGKIPKDADKMKAAAGKDKNMPYGVVKGQSFTDIKQDSTGIKQAS